MMNRAVPRFDSSLFLFFLSMQTTLFAFDSPTAALPQEVKAHVIDGKLIASKIQASLKAEVDAIIQKGNPKPVLAIVQVGNNPASAVYVRNKRNACLEVGITPVDHHLPETTTEKELLTLLEKLNADSSVNGILVQLPLPKQINPLKIQNAIRQKKMSTGLMLSTRKVIYRRTRSPCPLHSSWNDGDARKRKDRSLGKDCRRDRPKQYRRQAHCRSLIVARCNRHHLPFQDAKSPEYRPPGRYRHCRRGPP